MERFPWVLPTIISFAIIFGPAFTLFSEYEYNVISNPDIGTYLGIAEFDFDQSPIRRYRVIIPFFAMIINAIFAPLFDLIQPWSFPSQDFSLCFSFFIINMLFMSIFGAIIYQISIEYGTSKIGAFMGLLSVLTCRWTSYLAGLPLIDSLYLIVIGLFILGIKTKNKKYLIFVIIIGPWAKESFLFIAPLIFIYGSEVIKRWRQFALFILSGVLVFSFRYYFDSVNNLSTINSLATDLDAINDMIPTLGRLFSFHGLYELISVVGLWGILFFFLIDRNLRKQVQQKSPSYSLLFGLIVLVHMLLSGELARMFYLLTPLIALWIGLIVDYLMVLTKGNKSLLLRK